MKELEIETYNFAVDGIGFIKSLEKEKPELNNQELKKNIGAVSLKFIDALNAKENDDFANNLRACYSSVTKSTRLISELEDLTIQLKEQKEKILKRSKIISDKLDQIISKLIY